MAQTSGENSEGGMSGMFEQYAARTHDLLRASGFEDEGREFNIAVVLKTSGRLVDVLSGDEIASPVIAIVSRRRPCRCAQRSCDCDDADAQPEETTSPRSLSLLWYHRHVQTLLVGMPEHASDGTPEVWILGGMRDSRASKADR